MPNDTIKIALGSLTVTAILGFILFALLLGPLVTWWLFNYLAPIFNLRQIHFWEAAALYVLINMLTSGFANRYSKNHG